MRSTPKGRQVDPKAREAVLARTMVELADTLVDEFDDVHDVHGERALPDAGLQLHHAAGIRRRDRRRTRRCDVVHLAEAGELARLGVGAHAEAGVAAIHNCPGVIMPFPQRIIRLEGLEPANLAIAAPKKPKGR
jgi:hypothetical protein